MSLTGENHELNKLVDINKDACEFYETATTEISSPEIKQTFRKLQSLHEDVVVRLQDYIRKNGGKTEAEETIVGKTTQFWAEMMAKISNDVDETMVTHLEAAEDRCLHSMQNALKDDALRPETKSALQDEMRTLQKTHDYMKALKDTMKAA